MRGRCSRSWSALDDEHRYTFFVDSAEGFSAIPDQVELRAVQSSKPTAEAASANGYRSPADMWRMGRALSRARCDLLLFPTVYSYVPVWTRAKKLVIIHDVIAERFPQHTLPNPRARLFWKLKVGLARRQADALVTVSDYSKRCIAEQFGTNGSDVFVVGEAPDPVFRRIDNPQPTARLRELGIDGSFPLVCYLGGFGPHKNLEALVEAFCHVAPGSNARLVLIGENRSEVFHSYFSVIEEQLRKRGLWDRVICTGYLPDDDVVVLLNGATVLVLPSLMEGFGLPAVEAAACGCPVIATTESPLPQLLGEGGLFVAPHDQSGWNEALSRVLADSDLRERLRSAGLAAVSRLSWRAAALQMRAVIDEVARR